ncbi:hypothetical protein OG204_20685 [Streptomyces sp. NBC_01387]|uniref:hypothetical protein n=1 Tax=unclassified Streptomyces TaxID=2593676 RepID=UPI002023F4DF|nr:MULTISPECIES: hypothetical protein [unclassified Streptomyces]MCX4549268.1 hypothetical protein [Streptomyces sp. NBC_01500]WSC20814.1 hypothetical protein OIE60_14575 [Streptomyces sp. NBC_01766]WSV54841.1 hypothetical protein OG282_14620 [Streptomyces sp. NBC_01014]
MFIAGDVYGDVNNHHAPPGDGRDDVPQALRGQRCRGKARPAGNQPEEEEAEERVGAGEALFGWTWLTVMLFGASGYCVVAALMGRASTGDRLGSVLGAVCAAFGGVVALTFVFAALAEVCAKGTVNASEAARNRGAQGQRAAARLNLRYAVSAARAARFSAILAGFTAGLFGFLAIGREAVDRAHGAYELAESEIAETRSALGEILDEE